MSYVQNIRPTARRGAAHGAVAGRTSIFILSLHYSFENRRAGHPLDTVWRVSRAAESGDPPPQLTSQFLLVRHHIITNQAGASHIDGRT